MAQYHTDATHRSAFGFIYCFDLCQHGDAPDNVTASASLEASRLMTEMKLECDGEGKKMLLYMCTATQNYKYGSLCAEDKARLA